MSLTISIGSTVLADGNPLSMCLEEFREGISGTRAVQIEEAIRAGEPTFFDRLTVRNELSFTVRKQVTGAARVMHLALTTRQNLAGTGQLKIELLVDGVTHRWVAARAAWTQTQARPLGASVAIGYTVTCGTFVYSTSDEEEWVAEELDGGEVAVDPEDGDLDGGAVIDEMADADDVDGGTVE